tara:strand:+ start:64 stop:564 length:501 start_codon:yes stop_codon:yes gene_type:complete
MHDKKKYINKSMYSIQGIKSVGNSLPSGLKTILKKGGHNYSSIINNWINLVGKKIANVAYPKSIKTGKELKNGTLFLNVNHGDQLLVEYSKKDIIDKINSFFGYEFIKEIRLVLIKRKIQTEDQGKLDKNKELKYKKNVEKVKSPALKKNLNNLINIFSIKNKLKN